MEYSCVMWKRGMAHRSAKMHAVGALSILAALLVIVKLVNVSQKPEVKLGILRERRFEVSDCILPGICRVVTPNETEYYLYSRQQTFNQNLSMPVQYGRSIAHDHNVVPNIVHVTWYGGAKRNTFLFHHFVCLQSIHRFVKPKYILFWFDRRPEGGYWDQAAERFPEIVLVYKAPPTTIMGQPVKVPEHQSDIVRLEALMEYGGIYMDLDVIVLKSLSPLQSYDMTMGYETPDGLCNGVMVARPWADFLKIWYKDYKTLDDSVWGYHSVLLPAKLALKYPNLINTEFRSMNHPNPGESFALLYGNKSFDWQTTNYVVHTWIRTQLIAKKLTAQSIRNWDCVAGEIFRYIYYGDKALIPPH
ncbi:uncharacterized protein LOC124149812 [Haliotis rufescens]|uniref:uncharacterized protein LOC124149812 n=1 Tax=Haliotis rufescens TaxID=6454 RepID=UPI00201F5121|nr:uncharacterized protein LOC124149812 [Haliotis rufescens]